MGKHRLRYLPKRFHGRVELNLIAVPTAKRNKNADVSSVLKAEDRSLMAAIPAGAIVIALDRAGKELNTLQMSITMEQWMQNESAIAILIGGPEGLSQSMLQQANQVWRLSALTFAHPVARIVIAEQLYRSFSILERLPYHR